MMQQAPANLRDSNIGRSNYKPLGLYTQFKQWSTPPNSSNNSWKPDEIIKFLLNLQSGVMDPYRSHFEFTVETTKQTLPVGGLQVDCSAHSFIAQSVVSSYNAEVQRIAQYDTLATYLIDIGTNQQISEGRDAQGMGWTFHTSNLPYNTGSFDISNLFYYKGTTAMSVIMQTGSILPTTVGIYAGCRYVLPSSSEYNGYLSPASLWGASSNSASPANPYYSLLTGIDKASTSSQIVNGINTYKHGNNVRAEYLMRIRDKSYLDGTTTYSMETMGIKNQTWTLATMMNHGNDSGFNPKSPYQIQFAEQYSLDTTLTVSSQLHNHAHYDQLMQTPTQTTLIPNTVNINGFQSPFSAPFSKGANQTIISPTIPQCQFVNGHITDFRLPVARKTFRIPFLSNICGALIPPQSFTLIPMKALKNLLVELTLSKYPLFTTGYCDVHQFDKYGMGYMQPRAFTITNFNWIIHLYTFANNTINAEIQASLVKQIAITCTGYSLSSQYQIPNGSMVNNVWPISAQNESVAEVIILFLSNDYNRYTFRRKQQRLSNNITSMQFRLNAQYYPSQPIVGNAGCPQSMDQTGNNWPFYKQLLLSNNYLFNTNFPLPRINPKNFAINSSCYNVQNNNPMYATGIYQSDKTKYVWGTNSVNIDTAMGMPNFHENRYIGKAVYVFTWEPYGFNNAYMHGIDVSASQNFAVIFNVLPTDSYNRDQTMLIFTRYNEIVVYTQNGVKALG